MAKLNLVKSRKRTTLVHFYDFLKQLNLEKPNHTCVIVSGHACNYWIEQYKSRAFPGATWTATSGKDLDLLIEPKLVGDVFMKWEGYEAPAIFIADMLFMLARKTFLRSPITPFVSQFIIRCGQVKTWASDSKEAVHVDFFSHPPAWHPNHVRKHAVQVVLEDDIAVNMMSPMQCLWNFISAAADLDQKRGDGGVKRNRRDHERVQRLIPVVKEYLLDLKSDQYGEDSKKLWQQAMYDLDLIKQKKQTAKIEKLLGVKVDF